MKSLMMKESSGLPGSEATQEKFAAVVLPSAWASTNFACIHIFEDWFFKPANCTFLHHPVLKRELIIERSELIQSGERAAN